MRKMGKIQGNAETALPVIVGKSIVYVHDNIEQIDENIYEYDETQYMKDEYTEFLSDQQQRQQANIDYLSMMSEIDLPDEL